MVADAGAIAQPPRPTNNNLKLQTSILLTKQPNKTEIMK